MRGSECLDTGVIQAPYWGRSGFQPLGWPMSTVSTSQEGPAGECLGGDHLSWPLNHGQWPRQQQAAPCLSQSDETRLLVRDTLCHLSSVYFGTDTVPGAGGRRQAQGSEYRAVWHVL